MNSIDLFWVKIKTCPMNFLNVTNRYMYYLQVNGVEKLNVDDFFQAISNNSLDSLVSLFAFIALEVDLCLSYY